MQIPCGNDNKVPKRHRSHYLVSTRWSLYILLSFPKGICFCTCCHSRRESASALVVIPAGNPLLPSVVIPEGNPLLHLLSFPQGICFCTCCHSRRESASALVVIPKGNPLLPLLSFPKGIRFCTCCHSRRESASALCCHSRRESAFSPLNSQPLSAQALLPPADERRDKQMSRGASPPHPRKEQA